MVYSGLRVRSPEDIVALGRDPQILAAIHVGVNFFRERYRANGAMVGVFPPRYVRLKDRLCRAYERRQERIPAIDRLSDPEEYSHLRQRGRMRGSFRPVIEDKLPDLCSEIRAALYCIWLLNRRVHDSSERKARQQASDKSVVTALGGVVL